MMGLLGGCSATKQTPAPDTAAAAVDPNILTLTPEMKRRANIQTTAVVRQALVQTITYSAVIQPSETKVGSVSPLVGGEITEMLADIGDTVRKGQPVARMNTTELGTYQQQLLAAQSQVQAAQSQVKLAQSRRNLVRQEVARERLLVQKGISSLQDAQQAEGRLTLTEVDIANAQAQVRQALAAQNAAISQLKALGASATISSTLTLVSPIKGVVVTRDIEPGKVVLKGDKLFTIADLREVWVVLQVPQAQASSLPNGTPISFTNESAPGQTFRGQITGRAQDFDPLTRNIGIRATVQSPTQALKPGLTVLAQAQVRQASGLSIPTVALQQVAQKTVVFIQKGDRYYLQKVSIGAQSPQNTLITQGLHEGEQVVTNGSFVLKGQALKATLGGAE